MNIEFSDKRGLLPVCSFPVEETERVLGKWPNLRPQIIGILGWQPWLALELLRRGKDLLTHSNNSVTVVLTVTETSQSDWANVRDEIAKQLEEAGLDVLPWKSAEELYSMAPIEIQGYCPITHIHLKQGQGEASDPGALQKAPCCVAQPLSPLQSQGMGDLWSFINRSDQPYHGHAFSSRPFGNSCFIEQRNK